FLAVRRNDVGRPVEMLASGEHGGAEAVGAPVGHAAARVVAIRSEASLGETDVVGPIGRRPEPHVPIQSCGNRLFGQVAIARRAPAIHKHFFHLAERTAPYLPRPIAVVAEHPLAAAGEDSAIAADRFDHRPAFADGQRLGLLAVDVLALAAGFDADEGVPVVRRADWHRVDVGPGQGFPEIGVSFAVLVAVLLVDVLLGPFAVLGHDVADGDHLDFRKAHEAAHIAGALAAGPDSGHDDALAGRRPPRLSED